MRQRIEEKKTQLESTNKKSSKVYKEAEKFKKFEQNNLDKETLAIRKQYDEQLAKGKKEIDQEI